MQENKNHASPLLQAVAIQHTHSSYSKSATGGSTRRRLAPEKNKTFARHCIRFVFSENHTIVKLHWNLIILNNWQFEKIQKGKLTDSIQIHQNIVAKLQDWLPKLTRVRFASLKKSSFFFCKNQEQNKKSIFWSALASMAPACDHMGIMFRCILRCKLGGWWLLIYVYRSAGIQCYFLRNIGWFYIKLLWLSVSLSRLPF